MFQHRGGTPLIEYLKILTCVTYSPPRRGSQSGPIGTPPSGDSDQRIKGVTGNPMGSRFDADLQFTLCGSGDSLLQQRDDSYRISKGCLRNLDQMPVMREEQDLRLAGQLAKDFKPCCCAIVIEIDKEIIGNEGVERQPVRDNPQSRRRAEPDRADRQCRRSSRPCGPIRRAGRRPASWALSFSSNSTLRSLKEPPVSVAKTCPACLSNGACFSRR